MAAVVTLLGCKLHLLMNDENSNTPKNEAFRWLEPGAKESWDGSLSQSAKGRYLTSDIKDLSISLCYSF